MPLTEDFTDYTQLATKFSFRVKMLIKEDDITLQENTFFDGFNIDKMERHSIHLPPSTTIRVAEDTSGAKFSHIFVFSTIPVRVTGSLFLDIEVQQVLCLDWEIGQTTLDITSGAYTETDQLPNVEVLLVGEVD